MLNTLADPYTLAGQLDARPFTCTWDVSGTTVLTAVTDLQHYVAHARPQGVQDPIHCALHFYALEHAVGSLRRTYGREEYLPPMARKVMDMYHETGTQLALDAYIYLLAICSRELRHTPDKSGLSLKVSSATQVPASRILELLDNLPDEANLTLVFERLKKHAGSLTLGQLAQLMCLIYYHGSWGPSYGGPLWGYISEVLLSFIEGKTTPAMLLDTVWTLAHNTAPIFNKGMVYTSPNTESLRKVLNVQRIGQIPALLLSPASKMPVGCVQLATKLQDLMGPAFWDGNPVDWTAAENAAPQEQGLKAKIGAAGKLKFPLGPDAAPVTPQTSPAPSLVPGTVQLGKLSLQQSTKVRPYAN